MGYNPLYTLVENIGESGTIAQLVEHRVEAAGVGGSNPFGSTKLCRWQRWSYCTCLKNKISQFDSGSSHNKLKKFMRLNTWLVSEK